MKVTPRMQRYVKPILLLLVSTLSTLALSHDGHGLEGNHWHASDAWGFVAFAAVTALAIWFSKGGDQ
jgi:hypothetical protein